MTSTATINATAIVATYTNFVSDDLPTTTSGVTGGTTGTGLLGAPSQTTAANIFKSAGESTRAPQVVAIGVVAAAFAFLS